MKKGDLVVTALWLVVALGGLLVAAVAAVLG